MLLAARWGRLAITEDRQVPIVGLHMCEDEVIADGAAVDSQRDPGSAMSVVLADCVIERCTVAAVADVLIERANRAVVG